MSEGTYYCTRCYVRTSEASGRCPNPECRAWNTLKKGTPDTMSTNVVRMGDIDPEFSVKVPTGLPELDAALGGGTIPGQVILLGGGPGAGKSTMLLTVADAMKKRASLNLDTGRARKKKNDVLLVSTEEDVEKIRARSIRIKKGEDILVCHNRKLADIESDFASYEPQYGIVDSVNMIEDASSVQGTVTTLKRLYDLAHTMKMTMFVIAHVNGENEIAGMISLQHAADTVALLERARTDSDIRALRMLKNRQGPEDYVGLFEMTSGGLISFDPLRGLSKGKLRPGQAFTVAHVGGKMFPIEVQALASDSDKSYLHVVGYPADRVEMMLAVMHQHTMLNLPPLDVYVSILGGMNYTDTAIDLAVIMAIASAFKKESLPTRTAYIGEVELLGRVKTDGRSGQRKEVAERHGFKVSEHEAIDDVIEEAFGK